MGWIWKTLPVRISEWMPANTPVFWVGSFTVWLGIYIPKFHIRFSAAKRRGGIRKTALLAFLQIKIRWLVSGHVPKLPGYVERCQLLKYMRFLVKYLFKQNAEEPSMLWHIRLTSAVSIHAEQLFQNVYTFVSNRTWWIRNTHVSTRSSSFLDKIIRTKRKIYEPFFNDPNILGED